MNQRSTRWAVFALFFISGACGLIYETVWVRMMGLVFGISTYAISAVLCSFMAGLALGSMVFGRLSGHLRRHLAVYGLLEIGVAAFALAFPWILKAIEPFFIYLHHTFFVNYYLFCLMRFLVIFPILLVPTFLMGGTLPIITQYIVRSRRGLGHDIGTLYAVNTMGAVGGTFVVGFYMLARLGMHKTTLVAAGLNLAVGLGALALGKIAGPPEPAPEPEEERAAPAAVNVPQEAAVPAGVILWAIGLSGVVSLGLQILWNRVLVYHTHNSNYAFSTILLVFLVGLALGSWIFSLVAGRLRRPFLFFAAIEFGIALWSVLSFYLLGHLNAINSRLSAWIPWNNFKEVLVLILVQVTIVLFVPTVLMGISLPLAIRMLTRCVADAGRKTGLAYAANTVGTVVGTFVVGFVIIPLAGVRNTFIILVALNIAIVALLLLSAAELPRGLRRAGALAAILFVAASQFAVPRDAIRKVFEDTLGRVVFYHEDVTDTVMALDLYDNPSSPQRQALKELRMIVYADGRGTAGHPTRCNNRFAGQLPMLLHPDPKDVLVVCIGAGNTIGGIIQHERLKTLDCVDLSKGCVKATAYIETNNGCLKPPLDPRMKLYVEDGRNYLLGTQKKYDIIAFDPPELHTAGVVFLFTKEFYQLCKDRLKPGGIMVNWISQYEMTDLELRQVAASFHDVFPHGTMWSDPVMHAVHFIGSDRPLSVPLKRVSELVAREPKLRADLKLDKMDDPLRLFSLMLMNEGSLAKWTGGVERVTDDMTIVDYTCPKSAVSGFGYIHIFSPLRWDAFMAQGREVFSQQALGHAAWDEMARLTYEADPIAPLIDWTGYSEGEKAAMLKTLAEIDQARKRVAKYPRWDASYNIFEYNLGAEQPVPPRG